MMETAQHENINLLGEIWKRNQILVLDRLLILEKAAKAAAQNTLQPALREDASSIAHKLAGSLGMFGFAEGTHIAREIEHLLEVSNAHSATLDPRDPARTDAFRETCTDQAPERFSERLTDLTVRLRKCLFPNLPLQP
jgi:HPt (histidine-containing phosphotransfer) domain-containing protein